MGMGSMKTTSFTFILTMSIFVFLGLKADEIQKMRKVFISGVGNDMVLDLDEDTLRIRQNRLHDSDGYLVDNCEFYPDWKFIERYFERHKIDSSRFIIKDG